MIIEKLSQIEQKIFNLAEFLANIFDYYINYQCFMFLH